MRSGRQLLLPSLSAWYSRPRKVRSSPSAEVPASSMSRQPFLPAPFMTPDGEQLALPGPLHVTDPVVICVFDGSRPRVRPLSEGYNRALWCRFPRALRQPGARYGVAALEMQRGVRGQKFYVAHPPIRRLDA